MTIHTASLPLARPAPRPRTRRFAVRWAATFVAFPVGGLLARTLAGPVDDSAAALLGGVALGAALGAAQYAAAGRERLGAPETWVALTAAYTALGLAIGAAAVDYGTALRDLALQGAITGAVLGAAQSLALMLDRPSGSASAWPTGTRRRAALLRPLATTIAFSTGWAVATLAGVDVERQYASFGATGAICATAILGVALELADRAGDR